MRNLLDLEIELGRIQAELEEQYAREAEENFNTLRTDLDRERKERREAMDLWERLEVALLQIALVSDTTRGDRFVDEVGYFPPGEAQRIVDQLAICETEEAVLAVVRRLEEMADAHLRAGARRPGNVPETPQEKDTRILKDYEGLTPEVVSGLAPDIAPSPKVVRHVRRQAGRHVETGHRK